MDCQVAKKGMGMNDKAKIVNYQGLRGIAFLLIFISHCMFFANEQEESSTAYFGAFGVSLFIVLSGFLTVYNHNDCNDLSTKEQFTKTLKKCYPLHFLTFLLAIPFSIKELIIPNINAWIASFLNIILVQSWIPIKSVYFYNNPVSWYFSTYLFIMLVSPFVVKYFYRFNTSCIIGLMIFNLSIQIALVLFTGNYSWAHWIIYICPITRTLDFISGGGIAILIKRLNIQKHLYYVLLLSGSIVSLVLLLITTQNVVGNIFLVAIWSLPTYAIIVGLFGMEQEHISRVLFQNKYVLFLGEMNLELFFVHSIVIRYVEVFARKLKFVSSSMYMIAFLITILSATILHKLKFRIIRV